MHPTIGQIFYPDRQAFFAKLSLSLSLQPAIKTGPAPLPCGAPRPRITRYANGGTNGDAEQRTTKHEDEDHRGTVRIATVTMPAATKDLSNTPSQRNPLIKPSLTSWRLTTWMSTLRFFRRKIPFAMEYWAVSDLNQTELRQFADLLAQ